MNIRTRVAIVLTLAGLSLLCAPNAALGSVEPDSVKYHIAGAPINGHRGGRLTDPLGLRPGWIQNLPPDGHGDGVIVADSAPIVAPGAESPTAPPRQLRAAPASDPASTAWTLILVRGAGLLLTAALLAIAVRAMRGGTGRRPHATSAAMPVPAATVPALSPRPESGPVGLRRAPAMVGSPWATTPVVGGLQAELRHGGQRLQVRLVEPRRSPTGWSWLQPGETPPPAALPILLGGSAGMRLHVDLAATPDVVTIIGSPAACCRLVLAYADQLRAAGAEVVLVGGALAGTAPLADPTIATVAELLDDPFPGRGVIICDRLVGAELMAARELLTQTDGQLVPVIIGPVLPSRWSVRVES